MTRVCPICRLTKPVADYLHSPPRGRCKPCRAAYRRQHYRTPKGKEAEDRRQKKAREQHPERYQRIVRNTMQRRREKAAMPVDTNGRLLTAAAAARLLGIDVSNVYRRIKKGQLRAVVRPRPSNHGHSEWLYIPRKAIEAQLEGKGKQ